MKNLPKIQVLEVSIATPTGDLINDALLIKTAGDPAASASPVSDTVLHGQANTLQTMYTGFKTSPPTYTSGQVTTQKKIVVISYNKVARYLEAVANDVAIAAGDVTAGNSVVTRCGAKLKKKGIRQPKTFKASSTIAGEVDIDTKAVAPRATYIREYGTTTAKEIPPTVTEPPIITMETAAVITNLTSRTIIAIREASILPIPRKKKTTITPGIAKKSATVTPATKTHKAIFTHGTVHYTFGDWIYVVVK